MTLPNSSRMEADVKRTLVLLSCLVLGSAYAGEQLSGPAGRYMKVGAPIDDLGDVNSTGKTNGDFLRFNSTNGQWEPGVSTAAVSSVSTLGIFNGGVQISSPTSKVDFSSNTFVVTQSPAGVSNVDLAITPLTPHGPPGAIQRVSSSTPSATTGDSNLTYNGSELRFGSTLMVANSTTTNGFGPAGRIGFGTASPRRPYHFRGDGDPFYFEGTYAGESFGGGVIGPILLNSWWNKSGNGSPANVGDYFALLNGEMNDSVGDKHEYSEIGVTMVDPTAGSEYSRLMFSLIGAGSTFLQNQTIMSLTPITNTGAVLHVGPGEDVVDTEPATGGGYFASDDTGNASFTAGAQPTGGGAYTGRTTTPIVLDMGVKGAGILRISANAGATLDVPFTPNEIINFSTNGVQVPSLVSGVVYAGADGRFSTTSVSGLNTSTVAFTNWLNNNTTSYWQEPPKDTTSRIYTLYNGTWTATAAITDAARKDHYNLFTSSNDFGTIGVTSETVTNVYTDSLNGKANGTIGINLNYLNAGKISFSVLGQANAWQMYSTGGVPVLYGGTTASIAGHSLTMFGNGSTGGSLLMYNADQSKYFGLRTKATTTGGGIFDVDVDTNSIGAFYSPGDGTLAIHTAVALSLTKAQLNAATPFIAGEMYYCLDCSVDDVVVATGTTNPGSWARPGARSTAIN